MTQLPLSGIIFWTVTQITLYIRDIFEKDPVLTDIWVQGEVSNLSRPSSGHMYLSLKDSNSSLRIVMWRNIVLSQSFIPQEGQAVQVHGSFNIYQAAGQYQLYADHIRPAGEGALYQKYLRLKNKLESEGFFDPNRKRPIPVRPVCIGLITSPTGSALRDIINTINRRYPIVDVILAPTSVQGEEAPSQIAAAIQKLNLLVQPDVIILARGGGSIEDLWAFNEELVARAIFESNAPIITGVGHETDFTIADFVSDLRAPTPTAAAELATPHRSELQLFINDYRNRLSQSSIQRLKDYLWDHNSLTTRLNYRSPITRINNDRQSLDDDLRRLSSAFTRYLQLYRIKLSGLGQILANLDPTSILERGFSIVTTPEGKLISSVIQVSPGDRINITLKDGQTPAEILVSNDLQA